MAEPPIDIDAYVKAHASTGIVPPDVAAAIGYVAIAWSALEFKLRLLLTTSLDLGFFTGMSLLAEIPSLALINQVSVLIGLIGDKQLSQEWLVVQKRLGDLRASRNDILHSDYAMIDGEPASLRTKARYSAQFVGKAISAQEILRVAQSINTVRGELTRVMYLIDQSPRKSSLKLIEPTGLMLDQPPTPTKPKKAPRPAKQSSAQKRAARTADGGSEQT